MNCTTHGRLKELLTGLEEEMADADDALSEKTDDLRSQEQVPTTEYMSPIPFDIQCVIFAVDHDSTLHANILLPN